MVARKKFDPTSRASEDLTGYWGVIDSDHAYIHRGLAWTAVVNTGAISALYKISFKTPTVASREYIHWRPLGMTTSAQYCQIELYKGDTFSGGTTVVPTNRNDNSTNVSAMQTFAKGTTVTLSGTLKGSFGIGTAGNPAARTGGGSCASKELVLAPNTSYSIGITPDAETTCILELFWYQADCCIIE